MAAVISVSFARDVRGEHESQTESYDHTRYYDHSPRGRDLQKHIASDDSRQ